ncbi:MAG: HAD family phosphatase [Hyphomicrobiales bacterium]
MMPRAVLWDLDGTLADTEPLHALAFDEAISGLGLTVPDGFHDSLLGVSEQEVFESLVAKTGASIDLATWRLAKFSHFSKRPQMVGLRPDVGNLPEKLFALNVPMAVVSNSTRDEVAFILKASGLDKYFKHTFSRADVATGKPAPDSYLLAASRLECAPSDCLVVEDSRVGSTAGINAGMTVIFHPQAASDDIPAGTSYLPPTESLWPVLTQWLGLTEQAAQPMRIETGT